jgi:hypothetical protein
MTKVQVTWRQANGNWYAVHEGCGEILAKVLKQPDGIWLASVFSELHCLYWDEASAKNAAGLHLNMPPSKDLYEFINSATVR